MRLWLTALALLAPVIVLAAVQHRWQTEISDISDEAITAYHGDSVDLQCKMTSYGQVVPSCRKEAEFLWQTNGMGNVWWRTNATCNSGIVKAQWSPDMDCGADSYTFFIAVQDAAGASYRINGTIGLLGSPYGSARDLPLPVKVLDFASVEVVNATNAPFAAREELEALRSRVDSLKAAISDPSAVKLAPAALRRYLVDIHEKIRNL